MTFATLESKVNLAVIARLSNCVATLAGVPLSGIFNNGYADIYNMDGAKPYIRCVSGDVSTAARGTAVVVNAVSYTVAGIEPDGTGLTRLLLEKV